jgi:tetratricopeptide (TPR) repeat protein
MANEGVRLAWILAGMGQFFVAGTATAVADMLQGKALRRHEMFQGRPASPWSALGIALVLTGLTAVGAWQILQRMHEPLELYDAGNVASRGGDLDRADSLFSRAISLRPDFGEAYLQRGMVRSLKKQYGLAVEDLDKAVEILPGQWTALVERGRNKLQLGKNEEAVADLSQSIVASPTAEAYYLRAIGQTRSGHMREATLNCSLALRMETRPEYLRLRAECYEALGKHGLAEFDRKNAESIR